MKNQTINKKKTITRNQTRIDGPPSPGTARAVQGATRAAFASAHSLFRREIVGGKEVLIPPPIEAPPDYRFVGRETELFELTAALGAGLNPVVVSEAGQGKTTAAIRVAENLGRALFLVHGHEDLDAENLLVQLVPTVDGFQFVIQPLLAAILGGGVVAVDEINRLNGAALASLHGLLDGRRTVCSSLLGMRFQAHPEFRFFGLANPFASPLHPATEQRLRPVFRWRNYTADEVLTVIGETEGLGENAMDEAFKKALLRKSGMSLRNTLTALRFARQLHSPGRDAEWCVEEAMKRVSDTLSNSEEEESPCA